MAAPDWEAGKLLDPALSEQPPRHPPWRSVRSRRRTNIGRQRGFRGQGHDRTTLCDLL